MKDHYHTITPRTINLFRPTVAGNKGNKKGIITGSGPYESLPINGKGE